MPEYVGLLYSQDPKRPMVVFVAPSEEIRAWGGVPHKTTDFLGGFQRPLSNRYEKIVDFFEESGNTSPTAIVVAFRPQAIGITKLPNPTDGKAATAPQLVRIKLPDEAPNGTLEELAKLVLDQISPRVRKDVTPVDEDPPPETPVGDAEDSDEPVPTESSSEDDWGVDVGNSALRDFSRHLESPTALHAFRDRLAVDIAQSDPVGATADKATILAEAESRLRELFVSLLQPAMIVDGQHRVWGASECERDIPFAVVGLLEADWPEQVFQFVVINKQARAISGEFLASIVNSSLTNREIQRLEERLDAAGLSTYETRILRLLNDDPDSPFLGMVSRGLEEQSKKITFKAAMSLAGRWDRKMTDRDPIYKAIFRESLPGEKSGTKAEAWSRLWKDYMFAFWSGVRNLYKDEHLWEPGTQLMFRATMEVMQDNFLQKKAAAGGVDYKNPIELREDVEEFYRNVPAGFFHTEWKRKELLTDDGQTVLREAINSMRIPGTKLKSLVKTDPLFTGANTKMVRRKGST